MKTCITCGVELEIPQTYSEAMKKSRKSRCSPCEATHQRKYNEGYRARNREKARADWIQWRLDNPAKYQAKLEGERTKRNAKKDLQRDGPHGGQDVP